MVCIIFHNKQSEYLSTGIHNDSSNDTSTGADKLNLGQECSTDKVYSVHLEFSNEQNNIGEEIRESLKKKFIQSKFGSMQMSPSALQSLTKEERSDFQ